MRLMFRKSGSKDQVPDGFIHDIGENGPENTRQNHAAFVEPIGEEVSDHEPGQQVEEEKHAG